MKVLVLGATGGTGRLIVHDTLEKGHSVVALVRSKARAPDLPGAGPRCREMRSASRQATSSEAARRRAQVPSTSAQESSIPASIDP